jgi:serine O-acetyltransferase
MFRLLRLLTGVSITRHCDAGPGLFFTHFGPVWINPAVRLGDRVTISQGVTLGLGGIGAMQGVPEIGDNVFIGPNATVISKVRIGDNCVIGANSLVVSDAREGDFVVGVPARAMALGRGQAAARPAADAPSEAPDRH